MPNENFQTRILVVDDERSIREGLKSSLEQMGYGVDLAESGAAALKQIKANPQISFVVSDYKMPGMSGFDVLKEVKKTSPQTKVVLMTGHGNVNHAVQAMQIGADDYLCKPFSIDELEKIIEKNSVSTEGVTTAAIYTQDANFINMLKKAERAAKSTAPILIEGPSGTGKELLARQIHEWSLRSQKSWVAINCAALPSGLLESELFGYEKGAFTGAMDRKQGRFEQADGGTLLLDEIGELDPILQAKLLRVLQEGEVDRLGGKKPLKVDVRIIATTNRNLEQLVLEGKFREDLYFRLYGVRFVMPALRARTGDIALLANTFLDRQSALKDQPIKFAPGVLETLTRRPWYGNIRELERAVERAAVLSENGIVQIQDFEFETNLLAQSVSPIKATRTIDDSISSKRPIKEMEKEIILKALEANFGNRTHTAKSLGMSLRTLRHKLKQYKDAGEAVTEFVPEFARQKLHGDDLPTVTFDAELETKRPRQIDGQQLA